jgi:mannose-6-phosphate isomerase class I
MGTHPSCPSALAENGQSSLDLKALLEQRPELLGAALLEFKTADLPFLFKVLSVNTALSIQSHPDKKLAEQLHRDKPEVRKGCRAFLAVLQACRPSLMCCRAVGASCRCCWVVLQQSRSFSSYTL